jgi:hypothetical protein
LNEKIVLVVPADVVAVSLAFESVKKGDIWSAFGDPPMWLAMMDMSCATLL